VPQRGKCRLCLKDEDLQESHFIPAALYPEKKTKTAATRTTVLPDPEQIKAYLLCRTCETKFTATGNQKFFAGWHRRHPGKILSRSSIN
jgi:5-methylcytosine-specific restriction endonuclease McrA